MDNNGTHGPEFDKHVDGKRISKQRLTIRNFMMDPITGGWHTLKEIEDETGFAQGSISAQLRHLRKLNFGGYDVNKRRRNGAGLWEYHVDFPAIDGQLGLGLAV